MASKGTCIFQCVLTSPNYGENSVLSSYKKCYDTDWINKLENLGTDKVDPHA